MSVVTLRMEEKPEVELHTLLGSLRSWSEDMVCHGDLLSNFTVFASINCRPHCYVLMALFESLLDEF